MEIKVVIVAETTDGPDMFFCRILCTQSQYESEEHYDAAKEWVKLMTDCDSMIAIDENDKLGHLFHLLVWSTSTLIDITKSTHCK